MCIHRLFRCNALFVTTSSTTPQGVRGELVGRSCTRVYDFPTLATTKFCFICHYLADFSMANYVPQFELLLRGIWVGVAGWVEVLKVVPIEMLTQHSFEFYTYHRPILHCLATIHNEADDSQMDRHSDQNRLIMQ